MSARIRRKSQLSIAREGFLDRRSKRCFWLLLSPQTKVARAGARNYPRRRQIMRLRRCAATPHLPRLRRATCLPAGRSVRGSDTPPACHSIPRTHQGGRLEGVRHSTPRTLRGEGLGLCGLGTRLPVTSSGGRLTPADGRGDEDRMEVGSENTWKREWNFCR